VPFAELDTAAIARTLSQIAEQPDDLADAFFERLEEVELPPEDERTGPRLRREEGFAVRLVRGGRTWLAARDGIEPRSYAEAVRQVARAMPSATYPEPALQVAPFGPAPAVPELLEFPGLVARAVRSHHVGFPLRLTVRRHQRWVRVVGGRLAAEPQSETFYSCAAELAWGRHGALLPELGNAAAAEVAAGAVALFRARLASPPPPHLGVAVLGPAAVAVLLHEALAHALEADTLALGGNPEMALGLAVAAPCLDVLDDPAAAPAGVRRTSDDEGTLVARRWLVRGGAVEQPLADAVWARRSAAFLPGAGRRGSRHLPPGPRSTFLELLPGETSDADLFAEAEDGLYLEAASRGALDPLSGEFVLHFPYAQRIRGGAPGEPLGPCRLRGRVSDLLTRVTAVGGAAQPAGAGWCAKGGQKLPVWARAPAIRLEGVEVLP
jgi:predicted Zn-dependent protease